MSLADLAALAQIAAAVLLIPSIVYLALQVRQNTAQALANAGHQYLETNKDLNLAIIANKQVASVYRRGTQDFEQLDADEKTQYFFYVAQYYQTFSTMHDLWRRGALPESTWHPIRRHLVSMMALPGTRHVFETWARTGLPPEFVAFVDALVAANEETYSLERALSGRAPATPPRDPEGA
jgi:hypothetical protein